jgi:hypothetical protein
MVKIVKESNRMTRTNNCQLTFEKIANILFKDCNWGYYLLGFIAIFSRYLVGLFGVLIHGKWIHENLIISLMTFILFAVTLFVIRYLKKSYNNTISDIIKNEREKQNFLKKNRLIPKKIWIIPFIGLIINQLFWFIDEYSYLVNHPEIVGTLTYRGANQGLILLIYEAIDGIFLFIIFVDLVTILLSICFLPKKIEKYLQIDEYNPDRCGGLSIIGKLLLNASGVYFLLVAIAAFGRSAFYATYIGNIILLVASIIFGIIIFFVPQYTTHKLIVKEKSKKINEITKELKKYLEKKVEGQEEKYRLSIIRLELFRIREEINLMREYPFNTSMLITLLGFSIFPIVTNILSYLIGNIL